MAELVVEGRQLVVRLSWWERIVALHGNVRVPISSVTSTRVEARPADALGRRPWQFNLSQGTGAFIDLGYGTRAYGGGRGFVALRQRRRRPAILVRLDPPSRFHGLLVTVADPEAIAAHIMDAKHSALGN